MTEKYTPEKVAELVAEARKWASSSPLGRTTAREVDRGILFARRLADALAAVSAERDAAEDGLFRVVQALGFDTDGATDAQGFFGPQTYLAKGVTYTTAPDIAVAYASEHRAEMEAEADRIEGDRDRLHKAITEALEIESVLPAIATEPRRILRAALEQKGDDDA